jgi:hypothetical protein
MDQDEEFSKKAAESKADLKPRTKDGKIINKLGNGEEQDSNQMEQIPNPFAAEQTYITEDDIKQARKGSYDNLDQDMQDMPEQIDSSALANAVSKLKSDPKTENLEDMFDNMQITVMGANKEEEKSEASFVSDNDSDDGISDSHFQEDENKIS